MLKHYISTQKTAKYFLSEELNSKHTEILIVLHGYGFIAENFIQEFLGIDNSNRLIIAPEGLNKFYLRGYSGDFGANWMTKEDRSHEIDDHISYLNSLVSSLLQEFEKPPKVTLLGFSQGAEMASRWSLLGNVKIDSLIIWSGKIAKDLDMNLHSEILNSMNLQLVIGDDDSFISEEALHNERKYLNKYEVNYNLIRFMGGHLVHQETLKEIFRKAISE